MPVGMPALPRVGENIDRSITLHCRFCHVVSAHNWVSSEQQNSPVPDKENVT